MKHYWHRGITGIYMVLNVFETLHVSEHVFFFLKVYVVFLLFEFSSKCLH